MISAVNAVREHSQLKGLHKHSILALATHARKDGSNAHVSQATIAKREGISRGVVNAAFQKARGNGEIVLTGKTPRGVGIYTFAPFIERVHQVDTEKSTSSPSRQVAVHQVDTYLSPEQTGDVHQVDRYVRSREQATEQPTEQPLGDPKFEWLKLKSEREEEGKPVPGIREFVKSLSARYAK